MELPERKIVLIGNTGYGKSSTGNTILGENVFITDSTPNSVTDRAVKKGKMVNGRKITVIDTPGFGTDCDKMTKSEILNALIECAPGVDAFIMVLKVGRYTRHENKVLQEFLNTYRKEEVLKHTVILFTFGEQLEGQRIEEFVKKSSQLQELVDQCEGRCHVIDNKYWNNNQSGDKSNTVQVKKLLDTIDEMVKDNGPLTNELLQKLEEKICMKIKGMGDNNLTAEEKRERAKEIVHNRLRQVVGAFTGFIFGALLGASVAVAFILILLTNLKGPFQSLVTAGARVAAEAAAATAGAAATTASTAGAAATTASTAGAAATTALTAGAAATTAGATAATGIFIGAATVGGLGGAIAGWKAAEESDSVYDAMIKATKLNYENVTILAEKVQEFVLHYKGK